MKNGYKVIDLELEEITSARGLYKEGIYEAIEGNLGKPLMLAGINVGGTEYPAAAFIQPYVVGDDFMFNAYGYNFDVTSSDFIQYASAKATNVPASNATTIAELKTTVNALLSALKSAGVMESDE